MKKKVAAKVTRKKAKSSASSVKRKGQVVPVKHTTSSVASKKKQTPPTPPVNGGGLKVSAKRAPLFEKYFEPFRVLVVEQNVPVRQIADQKLLPVSYGTMRRWFERENLEAQRQTKIRGPQALHADVLRAVEKLVQNLTEHVKKGNTPWKGSFDELQKGVSVLEKLSGEAYFPGHLSKSLELLVEYLRVSKQESLLAELGELLNGFTVWALARKG